MNTLFKSTPIIAALALATASQLASAQQLEEVLVTATKRSESTQDIPVAVSALTESTLDDFGVANFSS